MALKHPYSKPPDPPVLCQRCYMSATDRATVLDYTTWLCRACSLDFERVMKDWLIYREKPRDK